MGTKALLGHKETAGIPGYVVLSEEGSVEGVVHQNLMTQCMFFPLEPKQVQENEERDLSDSDDSVAKGSELENY